MSNIDAMIDELCPDGVEYRRLGEVGTFTRGSGIQKKDFIESGMPCIHYGQIYTHYGLSASETKSFILPELYKTRKKATAGDLVIATTSENEEDVCKCVAWLGDERCAVSGDAYIYSHSLNPKYVAYFFRSENFQMQKARAITGTKVLRVSGESMSKFEIPVPPIEVQREIVRILDTFAGLTDELTTKLAEEVDARKQQYAHYRDCLLSSESLEALNGKQVEMKRLGDVCSIQRGASPRPIKKFVTSDPDGIPWIKIGDVSPDGKYIANTQEKITPEGAAKSRPLHAGDFILSNSMSWGRPYILKIDGCIHDGWLSLTNFGDVFLPDFLYHLLKSAFIQQCWSMKINTGSVSNLNADLVKATPVPVPSLATQQKVVDILDRFDVLTTSLTEALPAELEARRQQYEYYRDRLLDFPRKEDAAR